MLRGASAGARSELLARLQDTSGDLARVGEDLFGVAGLLRGEAALRRVLTDAAIEPDAKATLAGNVLGQAVDGTTLDLVQDAVRRRWTAGRDLADTLEHLGIVALVRSSGEDAGRVSDELFEVRQLLGRQHDLRSALSDPSRSAADKGALLAGLLEGKVQRATLLLVQQAVGGVHGAVDQALEEFQHVAADAQGEMIATVHSARALHDHERERLQEVLSRQYSTQVHLQEVVEPALVGGVRVEIGDDVIDGTVRAKLEGAQRKLAG